jgi:hypothetical protein
MQPIYSGANIDHRLGLSWQRRYRVPGDESSALFEGAPTRLKYIARLRRDTWDDHPAFARPVVIQGIDARL